VTSAIPEWFLPVSVGPTLQKRDYIACDQGFANPVKEALREAKAIFGGTQKVACVLSLGSGEAGPVNGSNVHENEAPYELSPLVSSACKTVHDEFWRLFGELQVYYRFSVDQGLQSFEDFRKEPFGKIKAHTMTYLSRPETEQVLNRAVHYSEEGTQVTINNLRVYSLFVFDQSSYRL
jgi:hypothetical protein